jgi:hypothetical protein
VFGHLVRLAVATLAVAGAGGVVVAGGPPAQAATCASASGVSVVVDFHQLGGGAQSFCDAGGAGESAAAQFADAGYSLTYVDGEPFVCQVDAKPASSCQQTPPADAYWSLWWSDGTSGQWKYSSVGVTQLKVPEGGYVALSWQGQTSQAKPRVPATAHSSPSPSPSPTHRPSHHATSHPTATPHASSAPSSSASVAPPAVPSSSPAVPPRSRRHHAARHHTGSTTATPSPTTGAAGTAARAAGASRQLTATPASDPGSGSGGLPAWVAPLAVGVLFAGAGTILLVRRRGSGGP